MLNIYFDKIENFNTQQTDFKYDNIAHFSTCEHH